MRQSPRVDLRVAERSKVQVCLLVEDEDGRAREARVALEEACATTQNMMRNRYWAIMKEAFDIRHIVLQAFGRRKRMISMEIVYIVILATTLQPPTRTRTWTSCSYGSQPQYRQLAKPQRRADICTAKNCKHNQFRCSPPECSQESTPVPHVPPPVAVFHYNPCLPPDAVSAFPWLIVLASSTRRRLDISIRLKIVPRFRVAP